MGKDTPAEVKLAQRLVSRHRLRPPVDIDTILRKYAELSYIDFPYEDADGISINLKSRKGKTRVVINSVHAESRQRFTLAHELGHILIPWHFGTIIDHVDPSLAINYSEHSQMEVEASRFAAELLMPQQYVEQAMREEDNLAKVQSEISDFCQTSALAAAVRVSQFLPRNYIYATEKNGTVEFSGKTEGTLAGCLTWNVRFPDSVYDYCEEHFQARIGGRNIHWWKLPNKVGRVCKDRRDWREILDNILSEIGVPPNKIAHTKSSLNGILGCANGWIRKHDDYSADTLASGFIQRLKDRPGYDALVQHPDFEAFVIKRAEDMIERLRH